MPRARPYGEARPRVVHLLAHQGRGDVVLGVAGGQEHQGHGGDVCAPRSGRAGRRTRRSAGLESSIKPPSTVRDGFLRRTRPTRSWNSRAPRGSRLPWPTIRSAGSICRAEIRSYSHTTVCLTLFLLVVDQGVQRRGRDRGTTFRSPVRDGRQAALQRARPWTRRPRRNRRGAQPRASGATPSSSSSKSAVGAFPTTQMAPVPTSPAASLKPAAERVIPRFSDNSQARRSETKHRVARPVIPAATIPTSVTMGASLRRASFHIRELPRPEPDSAAYSRSAEAWITRSATARESGPRCERSTNPRKMR